MKVRDIMSRNVKTVTQNAPVRELWKFIMAAKVNALPVVDEKKALAGIISKEDLLEALYPGYHEVTEDFFAVADFEDVENRIREMGNMKAKDIMKRRVIFTREDTPVMRALSRMLVRRLNQMPVLSYTDRLVGVITKGDIFRALVKYNLLKR